MARGVEIYPSHPGRLGRITALLLREPAAVRLQAAVAWLSLCLPLTALGITRFRFTILGVFLGFCVLALLAGKGLPRLRRSVPAVYLLLCVGAVSASWKVLLCVSPDVLQRALFAAAGACVLLLLERRFRRTGARPTRGGALGALLILILATAVLFRLSWSGLFASCGLLAALLVVTPMVYFRPGRLFLVLWTVCAVVIVYEWMGFMNLGRYTRDLDETPPAGIALEVVRHGDPARMPGARYLQPGACEQTRGAFYMGEAGRTYRLNSDGSETVFFERAESSQNLIELCDQGIVITGSFEQKFILFADSASGAPLERISLESHPTTMVLSSDGRDLYVGASMPAMVFRVDMHARRVTAELDHYRQLDPGFSGICNILSYDGRIMGVYSSWFMADNRPGEVFSVDRDLNDLRAHGAFSGAWGFIVPGPGAAVALASYDDPPVYLLTPEEGPARIASVPMGYYYLAYLPERGLFLTNHWTTGEILAFCENDPERRIRVRTGGMGRMLFGQGAQVFTPSASGYLVLTFPPDICP